MPKCSVKQCKNNTLTTLKKDGISYFRFPRDEIKREKWRKIIAKERSEEFFKPNDSSVVCSCHFSENDLYYTKKGFRKIKKGVLPRITVDVLTKQPTTTTTTLISNIAKPTDEDTSLSLQSTSEENKTVEVISQTEQITAPDSIHPPSPISSESSSILDTPKTSYYKKSLRKCQKTIDLKNKQIQNLKKKNKRLMKRNCTLKQIVGDLKNKVQVPEPTLLCICSKEDMHH